jgi:hypothetical protein
MQHGVVPQRACFGDVLEGRFLALSKQQDKRADSAASRTFTGWSSSSS